MTPNESPVSQGDLLTLSLPCLSLALGMTVIVVPALRAPPTDQANPTTTQSRSNRETGSDMQTAS